MNNHWITFGRSITRRTEYTRSTQCFVALGCLLFNWVAVSSSQIVPRLSLNGFVTVSLWFFVLFVSLSVDVFHLSLFLFYSYSGSLYLYFAFFKFEFCIHVFSKSLCIWASFSSCLLLIICLVASSCPPPPLSPPKPPSSSSLVFCHDTFGRDLRRMYVKSTWFLINLNSGNLSNCVLWNSDTNTHKNSHMHTPLVARACSHFYAWSRHKNMFGREFRLYSFIVL